jgi:hypothetical protein
VRQEVEKGEDRQLKGIKGDLEDQVYNRILGIIVVEGDNHGDEA